MYKRQIRVFGTSSAYRIPARPPDLTMSTPMPCVRSPRFTEMSSPDPGASCKGSTVIKVMVRSSRTSNGSPQLEQKLLPGGFRWPHWLQNTYDTTVTPPSKSGIRQPQAVDQSSMDPRPAVRSSSRHHMDQSSKVMGHLERQCSLRRPHRLTGYRLSLIHI